MDIQEETYDFLRESIEFSLGRPVSTRTLELKLRSSEEAQRRLRHQYWHLTSELKVKDAIIERARVESSMNAQALRKFVDENQKLAVECADLSSQCTKWEKECSLYDHDREALIDFGNEADERAKESELRVRYLEAELSKFSEELQFYKRQVEVQQAGTLTDDASTENFLIDTLMSTLINENKCASMAHTFLEANGSVDVCRKMLKTWDSLSPMTRKVLMLASEAKILQKDKERLRINLTTAEEEVKILFEENKILDNENRRLTKRLRKERRLTDPDGSAKDHKRKSSTHVEKENESASPRLPLSPLRRLEKMMRTVPSITENILWWTKDLVAITMQLSTRRI